MDVGVGGSWVGMQGGGEVKEFIDGFPSGFSC